MILLNKQGKWFFVPALVSRKNPRKPSSCQSMDFPEFNRSSINPPPPHFPWCVYAIQKGSSSYNLDCITALCLCLCLLDAIRVLFAVQTTRTEEMPPMQSLCNCYSCHEPEPARKKKKIKNNKNNFTKHCMRHCGIPPYTSVPMKRSLTMYTYDQHQTLTLT